MSIKIMSKVWELDIKATKKLVLLAFADYSNDDGICYPSWNKLLAKCNINRATLSKYINELETENYLLQVKRAKKNGGRLSSKYLLLPLENFNLLDENDKEFFEPKFKVQTLDKDSQSLEIKPGKESQSLEIKPKPSLYIFNHHLYISMNDIEQNLFNEYLSLRKTMKLKNTNSIVNRLLLKYFDFGRDIKTIENAINANWKDFYPAKVTFKNKKDERQNAIDEAFEILNGNTKEDIIYEC